MRFILILIIFIFSLYPGLASQKNVYFYFENQFFVVYYEEFNKLFVDINSGFVIKPEEQQKKIKFVEYVLNTPTFISRDEDVFTKLYIFKKSIRFDFSEVEPTNVDYYSWGPLTYKYLSIFCKGIDESITIRIPSFDSLPEEDRKNIIERYRIVFGTSFNEPRYTPYDITITNVSSKNLQNIYNVENQVYTTNYNITINNTNAINTTTVNTTITETTMINNTPLKRIPQGFLVNLVIIVFFSLFGVVLLFFVRYLFFRKSKDNLTLNTNPESVPIEELKKSLKNMNVDIESMKKSITELENKINQIFQRMDDISLKTENLLKERQEKEVNHSADLLENYPDSQSDSKVLDKESIEMTMFKLDNLANKIKNLEIYKEMDINVKVAKIVSDIYDFKSKIRQTKSINFVHWDNFVKNQIIDLISTLDKYQRKYGYNENVSRLRKEIMQECDIEEVYIVLEQTKVNIIDHRVEGYSRNHSLPNGVITEVKEEGYKYKGITVKRAKVIENRI